MSKFLILGSGMQGVACGYDLLRHNRGVRVTFADANPLNLENARKTIQRTLGVDTATEEIEFGKDERELSALLQRHDTVISGLPYFHNFELTRLAVEHGCNMVDLGGNTTVVWKQHKLDEEARKRGVAIVPDCGLMPGMGNSLAAMLISALPADDPPCVSIYCGGLPVHPRGPLKYKLVFSPYGLINEYFGKAHIIRRGKRKTIAAFSEWESLPIPGIGELEAFTTTGGSSTAPWTFENRVQEYTYKTLRYPGHYAIFKTFLDMGFLDEEEIRWHEEKFSPRDFFIHLLQKQIDFPDDPDLVILLVRVNGRVSQREIILFDQADETTGFSAMQRTTGFPAAIVAHMITAAHPKGVLFLEKDIDNSRFFTELLRRGFHIRRHETSSETLSGEVGPGKTAG